MIVQYDQNAGIDDEEIMFTIHKFDSVQQRLPSDKRDINQYKSLEDVKTVLLRIGDVSKSQQKRTAKSEGAQHVGTVDGYDVYFITSHEAAMLLGKGTQWCITESNGKHWDSYVKHVKFFFAIRNQPQGYPDDKIAFACYTNHIDNKIDVFDAEDNTIMIPGSKLYGFIKSIKDQYKDYTATSKNQIITFVNGQIKGPVKTKDCIMWYKGDVFHREDGPALEYANGNMEWFLNGERHREDGPAIEYTDGTKEWYRYGTLHREDGPTREYPDGSKEWWVKGRRHREDGPAIEYPDGTKVWYQRGVRHREDGPAIERADGSKEWWLNGKEVSQEQFKKLINK
jgi:hypothetical protein